MSYGIVFHSLAALAYAALGFGLWRSMSSESPTIQAGRFARLGLLLAIILHGIALRETMLHDGHLRVSWSLALSAAIWIGMVVFWLESLIIRIDGLQLLLLPVGAIVCLLAGLFPQSQVLAHAGDAGLRIHLLIALSAYALVTIAALQAMLMAGLDHRLHFPQEDRAHSSPVRRAIGRLLDAQPPLLAQEQILFRLIWIAFAALTLTVISGALISLALVGRWLPFDHKSIFTLLAWLTFGILLLGRYLRGWRGRTALRYTLVGFAFVVLAYTGSRFVIEVILQRN
ncbi:cytochrome c biogenesis protein CcsA [Zwartia sp.]|uniref:cytochrome C assembly family protein n=1 Tax=Zwartia sp. TaxID=2978004 RepID=UPI00271BB0C1|nr:cytochrome c biogenesis protein CcsA [Zwartia sp.]MDO9024186.1 cytochrome c biogenesis protein CcsA [Zwartia sp.]